MSYQHQTSQLPFRYDAPMSQPMQFRNDNFPFIPNLPGIPQQFMYLVPTICAMIANETGSRCGNHPGRMFLFNQLSANNYSNNDFCSAINTVIDILQLNLLKGVFRSPEEGLQKTVSDTLSILASLNFQTYPGLMNVTDPNIVNEAHKNNQIFFSLQNEISQTKNRMQQPQSFQQSYQQPPQMMMNPNFQGGNVFSPQPVNNQPMNTNSGNVFSNVGNTQPVNNVPNQGQSTGKFDYLKPKAANTFVDQKSYFTKEPLPHVSAKPGEVTATAIGWPDNSVEELVWLPSSIQAYPLTIDPNKHKLGLRLLVDNGKKTVLSYLIPLKEDEMDRARHTITTMRQVITSFIPDQNGTRDEAINESLDKMFKVDRSIVSLCDKPLEELLPEDLESIRDIKTHLDPVWGIETSLESAIFDGRLSQKQSKLVDVDCTSYRVYKLIGTPVIGSEDHTDFIDVISSCKSFRELAGILNESITMYPENRSLVKLCYEIEKSLTKEINWVLRNCLSLPKFFIDSFMDDINDLPDYLGKKYGDIYKKAFLEFQKNFILQALNNYEKSTAEDLRENLSQQKDSGVVINFIVKTYSLTYLNIDSTELNIKPFGDCASSLMEDENKLMYKVASGIFKQDKLFNKEALHNLIITSDDKVYEIFTGMIGKDFYTICEL